MKIDSINNQVSLFILFTILNIDKITGRCREVTCRETWDDVDESAPSSRQSSQGCTNLQLRN